MTRGHTRSIADRWAFDRVENLESHGTWIPRRVSRRIGSKVMVVLVLIVLTLSGCIPVASTSGNGTIEEEGPNRILDLGEQEVETPPGTLTPPRGYFTRNDGQLDRSDVILYSVEPLTIGFTERGLLMNIEEVGSPARGVMVELLFSGADPVAPTGLDPVGHISNFFLGNDPSKWVTRVPSYQRVVYEEVWDDIDIEFLCRPGGMKYNIYVAAGGNVEDVGFEYRGAQDLLVNDQRLVLRTGVGEVVDSDLLIFQTVDDGMSVVPGRFVSTGKNSIGFRLEGKYDKDHELVIDPNLTYSTYMGSRNSDWIQDIAVGPDDTVYLTGTTNSFHFPVTTGAYQTQNNRGRDGVIVRMNSKGTDLVYSTYIGGSWRENCTAIAVDDGGNAYIVGDTDSNDFPVTNGAADTDFNGTTDGIILKLNAAGNQLLFSTFLGGDGTEWPLDVAIDGSNNVCVVGYVEDGTASMSFPTTSGAYCETSSGREEIFVGKLKADGSAMIYTTLIGAMEDEYPYAIAADDDGNAYITGYTWGNDFPVTQGAYRTSNVDEIYDLFITKFNPTGTALVWSTYLGGWLYEFGYDIQVDEVGDVYVTGATTSDDFPLTAGVYNTSYDNGFNLFITKMDADGAGLNFSTFVGDVGGGWNDLAKIAVGPDKSVYFVSDVDNWNVFPVTPGAFMEEDVSWNDVVFGRVSADGTELLYSSFLGGTGSDYSRGMAVDGLGNIYIGGELRSDDFPTTSGAYAETYGGETDGFIVKADIVPPKVVQNLTPQVGATNTPFTFSAKVWDNVGIASVEVVYWFGNGTETRATMTNATADEALFNLTLSDTPFASPLHYYLIVTDLDGNNLTTPRSEVPMDDTTGPMFGIDHTPTTGTTGDELMFGIGVTDNVGVQEVRVIYEIGLRGMQNLSMGSEAPYQSSIMIPDDAYEPLKYYFSSSDTSNNWNSTVVRTVTLIDDDRPVLIEDLSDDEATTGDDLRLGARWMDNIGIEQVNVVYWYGDDDSAPFNITMPMFTIGEYRLEDETVSSTSILPISYYFIAVDDSANVNITQTWTMDVRDNDPPIINVDRSDPEATTGDTFTMSVEVMDNIGIGSCTFFYWFDDETPQNQTLEDPGGSQRWGNYTSSIDVPPSGKGVLHYYLVLIDIWSNAATTETVDLDVRDDDAPIIGLDSTPEEGMKARPFTFSVVISDNMGVVSAFCEIDLGSGEPLNVSMDRDGSSWTAEITIDRDAGSSMSYRFSARDQADNWAVLPEWRVVDISNPPPQVADIPTWSVREGQTTGLELGQYISDDNDPTETLSVTCSDPNVTVEGQTITIFIDIWREEFSLDIRVSDVESEVPVQITVVMVDVNDPPDLPVIVTPANGTKVDIGEEVTFEGTFSDPDLPEGQVLVVEWTSSIDGLLGVFTTEEGVTPLVLDNLSGGDHTIILTVSDGRYTSSAWIDLHVKEDLEADGTESLTLILIVVALAIVGAIVVLVYLKGKPTMTTVDETPGTDNDTEEAPPEMAVDTEDAPPEMASDTEDAPPEMESDTEHTPPWRS